MRGFSEEKSEVSKTSLTFDQALKYALFLNGVPVAQVTEIS